MAKRATYYSDAVEAMIDSDPTGSESFSGRVGFLIGAAHQTAAESCPALTAREWSALADAGNGTYHSYELGAENVVSGMLHSLWDSGPELDDKWGVSCADLAHRIRSMPFSKQFAVFEVVRRFWVHGEVASSSDNYAEAFKKLGANVKP